jgi:lantibiotic modifying enzyme
LQVVEAIATTLTHSHADTPYSSDLALFFAYLARAQGEAAAADAANQRAFAQIEASLQRLTTQALSARLYGGLAGVGWTIGHLADLLLVDEATDELLQPIDELLLEHIAQTPWRGDYDLIGGLVGFGAYALERLPHPAGRQLLARVIERLAELAEEQAPGLTWHTSPDLLPELQRKEFPHGYYNLGISHGVPGVIALLGQAVCAGVAAEVARPLLEGAVRWLLAQDQAPATAAAIGGFPAYVDHKSQPKAARLAWCYGDVGIAAALLGAARRVGEPAWEEAALRIARRAAQRPHAESGVRDGCLCHGAAGLAHLFNRFYQATGEVLFAQQAAHWIDQTLHLRQPDQGVAGYCSWRADLGWVDSPGFLEGAAGIGLALLAASSDLPPAWDRLLLIDIPQQSQS